MTTKLAFIIERELVFILLYLDNKAIIKSECRTSEICENLCSTLASVLLNADLTYNDIEAVIIDIGPGNFTAIKMCCAFLYSAFITKSKSVYTCSKFQMLAFAFEQNVNTKERYCVLIKGRCESEFFVQSFQEGVVEDSKPDIIKEADLQRYVSMNNIKFIIANPSIQIQDIKLEHISFEIKDIFKISSLKQNNVLTPLYSGFEGL